MDIVEFTEKFYGAKLYECQKELLRRIDELRHEGKIYFLHGRKGPFIYIDKMMQKELLSNGTTNDCKQ